MSSSPSSGAALVVHLWVGCKELVLHADSGLSPQTTDERRARGEELQGERESLDQRLLDRPTRRAEGTCVHVVRERLRLIARGEPRLKRNDPPEREELDEEQEADDDGETGPRAKGAGAAHVEAGTEAGSNGGAQCASGGERLLGGDSGLTLSPKQANARVTPRVLGRAARFRLGWK